MHRLLLFFCLLLPSVSWSLPRQFAQEGFVVTDDDQVVDGRHDITIGLYVVVRGGQPIFQETHVNVEFFDGYYSIAIGAVEALPQDLFWEEEVYLGITLDDGREMTPRIPLLQVPAALTAQVAQDVVGDIHPNSVSIGNELVINEDGEWVGVPAGLRGPAGAQGMQGPQGLPGPAGPPGQEGGDGSPDTPAQVLAKLVQADGANSGVDADMLDGLHANRFMRRDDDTGTSGNLFTDKDFRASTITMPGAGGDSTITWPADGGFGGDPATAVIQLNNRDIGRINTLHIADPGPGEGVLWTNTGAKIVVSPLDDDNVDGYLRLINDGPISLESDVHIFGQFFLNGNRPRFDWGGAQGDCCYNALELDNRNINGANTIRIADPGPGEGILWSGSQAKIVVSPLDDSNNDGWLRLINDEGVSIESTVYASGRVGIGVSAPEYALDIHDGSDVTTGIRIRNYGENMNSRPMIRFEGITPGDQGTWATIEHTTGTEAGGVNAANTGGLDFTVSTGGNGSAQLAMSIKTTGDVGIGTTDPLGPLHVNGVDARQTPVVVQGNVPGIYLHDSEQANGALRYDSFTMEADGNRLYFGARPVAQAAVPGSGSRKLVLTNEGKVGIGITNPQSTLDVDGTIRGMVTATNRSPVGLEHNALFNAKTRYIVSQDGPAPLDFNRLFDGKMVPSYSGGGAAPSPNAPQVILIEGLPKTHTQAGAWIGWSTRYWPANRFKIEGYDVHSERNEWRVFADYENVDYSGSDFIVKVPGGRYVKLRYTFYQATGADGRIGVSEMFFIHPEMVRPYEGLLAGGDADGYVRGPILGANRSPVGWSHNVLFNAATRYTVEQEGPATLNTNTLFDGQMAPNYPPQGPTAANPQVVTISGMSTQHTQAGAWIGWTTRYWPAKHFTIEGYNTHGGANEWVTIADYRERAYSGSDFMVKVPSGRYPQVRYTFYEATGSDGRIGVSELFFIHPEATTPFKGLFAPLGSSGCTDINPPADADIGAVLNQYKNTSKCLNVRLAANTTYTWNEYVSLPRRVDVKVTGAGYSNGANNITSRINMTGARTIERNGVEHRCVRRLVVGNMSTFRLSGVYLNERINDDRPLYQSSSCRALFNASEGSVLEMTQMRGEVSEDVTNIYGHQYARVKFGHTFIDKTANAPRDVQIVKADGGWNFKGHGGVVARSHTHLGAGVTYHDTTRLVYLP